jgi:NADH-quinone oxidoreductase subunit L
MAGPTPVSALIHAATMVTSGIFLIARTNVLFALSPTTMAVVAGIGITTALFAGFVGLVQNDIKKVLAYSTVSQLGFMFTALGVGAFTAGVFHVMTHAFFKALLFLGSGSVIHGMHEEQDIQKMGGLKKYMPITYRTFLIGTLAISGIPFLSGFFSKDEILWFAFLNGSPLLWGVGVAAAFTTAFYMWRLTSLTFDGEERFDHHHVHPHESPATMTIPLIVLAVLSVFLPKHTGDHTTLEFTLMAISTAVAITAILVAKSIYGKGTDRASAIAAKFGGLHKMLWNKYWVDEIYNAIAVAPILAASRDFLWKIFDVMIIDGIINGSARTVEASAGVIRRMQSGVAQNYALIMMIGIVTLIGIVLWPLMR